MTRKACRRTAAAIHEKPFTSAQPPAVILVIAIPSALLLPAAVLMSALVWFLCVIAGTNSGAKGALPHFP
jgi:hypothetical protein